MSTKIKKTSDGRWLCGFPDCWHGTKGKAEDHRRPRDRKRRQETKAAEIEQVRALVAFYQHLLRLELKELADGKPVPKKWLDLAGIDRKQVGARIFAVLGRKCAAHAAARQRGTDLRTIAKFCEDVGTNERQYRRYVDKFAPILERERRSEVAARLLSTAPHF